MNEAGLVIELLWLEPPILYRTGALKSGSWIQYQLDMSATVDDVLDSGAFIRISGRTPLHYLVADRKGEVATIEFLDGRLEAHTGASLPVKVLTNHAYGDSLAFFLRRRGSEGPPVGEGDSLSRFARAAGRVRAYRATTPEEAVRYAFLTLQGVSSDRTRWSIVHDIGEGHIHFKPTLRPCTPRSLAPAFSHE